MESDEPPRYWRANAVSTLPEYANAEQVLCGSAAVGLCGVVQLMLSGFLLQEYILAAFSSGSFKPIRSIPEDIKASSLTNSRRLRVRRSPVVQFVLLVL